MLLSALLKSITIQKKFKEQDLNISGIAYNSKTVLDDYIFVCIKGQKSDGHDFLKDAVNKGAKAAIVEEINEEIDVPQFLVENSRQALAQLSDAFYDEPSKDMQMIGITATNGKTTTSYMVNSILEDHGLHTGLVGTIKAKIGDSYIPSTLTTPESLELQKYFREMKDVDTSHAIMEVSSAAQEVNRVDNIDFDIVTLNNIYREHIDTHGTFERYVDVKTRFIKNAKENSVAVLNLDCTFAEDLIPKTKATPVTFSVENGRGDLVVENLDISTGRAHFTVKIRKQISIQNKVIAPTQFDVELGIPGMHSVSNSMIAIIIALLNDVPISTIQSSLKAFTGVERRFEFIYEEGPMIVDDHFANPGNIDVTLETISKMNYQNLHLVYAIRGQRGIDVNKENAEVIAKWMKQMNLQQIIATKSVSDVTWKDEVTREEEEVFMDVMKEENIKVILFDELKDAIDFGFSNATREDLLLLAGCQGMDHGAEIILNQVTSSTIRM